VLGQQPAGGLGGVSVATAKSRLRDVAARSPLLRKVAGKAALYAPASATPGANASAWTVADNSLWPVAERYSGSFPLAEISYGTVRDFADSVDHMRGLAGASFDMKDLQRCWMVKAILGNVARGSRILEIGAGEPLVAGMLSRLGYDVTVVDDYEGGGNGPREFSRFKAAYPDLRFVRELFPPSEPLGADFDAVFSISVLEHVPAEQVGSVVEAGQALVAEQGGCSIHAVDHVLAGWGAGEHREKLDRIVAALGLSAGELAARIDEMERDPETYFVSAEAHNRWRGDLPYDQYTMRRIGSVNLFRAVG
jgi:SAM-dependent methyltransferase